MVPFAGWEMPVSYSGILDEHKAVRSSAGLFDVSHMGRFRVEGAEAGRILDHLITGRASTLAEGRFLYTMLLNERGGVVDDLLVGRLAGSFLVVVNAANRDRDFKHIEEYCRQAGGEVELVDESEEKALLALQGPDSRRLLEEVLDTSLSGLGYYRMGDFRWDDQRLIVSRTGYTGELGYEIFICAAAAGKLWDVLVSSGAKPCGLGARDTLRLEMGYPLYGHELDEEHTPLEAGLSWVVDFEKDDFIGKKALLEQRSRGLKIRLRGIEASRRDIPRQGYRLLNNGKEVGRLASGCISPSLNIGIGTAYLPVELASPGTQLALELRGRVAPVTVVKFPFYKKGTARD